MAVSSRVQSGLPVLSLHFDIESQYNITFLLLTLLTLPSTMLSRIRAPWMSWAAVWMLLACCAPLRSVAAQPLSARGPPVLRPRGLQGNNDKNNANETAAPTIRPTNSPSRSPTSSTSATTPPSAAPTTAAPTTAAPTTAAPASLSFGFSILEGSVGNLLVQLSVHDPSVSVDDVQEGRANELLSSVLGGVLDALCSMTDFSMVLGYSVNSSDACQKRRRKLQEEDSVVWSTARVNVTDEASYMRWTVVYPVLQIGQKYVFEDSTVEEVDEAALEAMKEEADKALFEYIEQGGFDGKLPETAQVTAVGFEDVFDSGPEGYTEQLDPAPLHALRVAGIILLIANIVVSFLLLKLSGRRKRQREMDFEIINIERGGLVTEEGVELMLQVGRRESSSMGVQQEVAPGRVSDDVRPQSQASGVGARNQIVESPSDDSEDRKLPLPRCMSA